MIVRLLDRTPAWALWFFVILMTALGVLGYAVQTSANADQTQQLREQRVDLHAQTKSITALSAAVAEANRRLASHGQPPVPVPVTPSTPAVPQVIIERPTAASISAAVRRYCAGGACKARGVTASQVRAALTAYCSTGACVGPAGPTGPTGGTGADGQPGATGDPGPGPTTEQVEAAVAGYCGTTTDTCQGRGIVSLACTSLTPPGLQIQVTYTDGTTQTVDCTVPVLPVD